ncbi:MAG: Crp/Fnr family transcriptional regulator [Calditrichaeota bacterium]|nr:Crp/Fnr family transcriptional regulator [Calditrichota bacterium]
MQKHRKTPLHKQTFNGDSCSTDNRLKILHDLPFFKNLPHGAVHEINSIFRTQHYQTGDSIYFSGDPAKRLCVVAAGGVKLIKHSSDGQDVLVDLLKQGEFFGALDILGETVYQETAEAQTDCCILKISSDQFRTILSKFPLSAINIIDILSQRLKSAYEMMKQLSVQPVEQRIAFTLLKLAAKAGKQDDVGLLIDLPLSRTDLAGMTGTTTETASRIMSQFQKMAIIKTGRQWVSITDPVKLEQLAESR